MGFLSSGTSFMRYSIVSDIPAELFEEIPERLQKNAFMDIDNTTDERSFGWTCFDDMLDTRWQTAPPEKGHYLAFSLRLETRRISPAVLKKYYAIALARALENALAEGKKYVSRDRKKEIKDQTKIRILTKTLPVPAVFDVVWNREKNIVYFTSTQGKMLSLFEDLFTLTFDLHLAPLTPYHKALEILGQENQGELEELETSVFV